ncbi:hypothetical protein AKJ66_03525, partial [candidate division MSBL1 archaeon SCGC-AAA259E22]
KYSQDKLLGLYGIQRVNILELNLEIKKIIEGDVWHTAVINVKAVKGDQVKNITAVVCINKNKVLIVTDFWCEAIMHAICVGGCGGIGGALIYYFPVSAPVAYELVEYCHMMGCPAFADWFCHDFL